MPKKDSHKDSTTDFFLKFITRQKEEKATKKETEIETETEETKTKDKAFLFLLKGVNNVNIILDKMLSSNISVKILSFVMTILLVFVINGGAIDNIFSSPTGGDFLRSVPVKVEGLSDDFEVSGVPETIDVMLIGPTFDIYATKVNKDYEVYIDLTNYIEGEHVVEYKYRNFSSGLYVATASEKVTIKIASKTTKTFALNYQFSNEDSLADNLSAAVIGMEHEQVEIRGSQDTIGKIYSVDAIIDLSAVTNEKGTFTQEAEILAYDRSGEEVNVEIIPHTVNVECELSTYSKEVDLVPKIIGEMEDGYAIAKIALEETKVRIYGKEEKLKGIKEVYVVVDVSGYSESRKNDNVVIESIEGINRMSITTTGVTVDIEKAETRTIEIPITAVNNTEDYKVVYSEGEGQARVTVTAAPSVLEKIDVNDFKATIDLESLQEGRHRVLVDIATTNYLLDYVLISKEKLIITLER